MIEPAEIDSRHLTGSIPLWRFGQQVAWEITARDSNKSLKMAACNAHPYLALFDMPNSNYSIFYSNFPKSLIDINADIFNNNHLDVNFFQN